MPYHYEVSMPYYKMDGPNDVTIEEDVREFSAMVDAVLYAKRNEGNSPKLFLVFKDIPGGQLEDRAELPLKLA